MMSDSILACAIVLAGLVGDDSSAGWQARVLESATDRVHTCMEVTLAARRENIPVPLAVAVAWTESKMNRDARSSVGAYGPFQVLAKYHADDGWKKDDPNLIATGARVLKKYMRLAGCTPAVCDHGHLKKALCHYNSGNTCNIRSRAYAKKVLNTRRRVSYLLKAFQTVIP